MWFNPVMVWLLRSPFHGMLSKNTMLIAYSGRKTGKSYVTPVNYLCIDEDGTQVFYTTSYRERVWWRNLRGGAVVTLTLRGKEVPAQAAVIEGENEVAKSLTSYLHTAPGLARYIQVGMDASGTPNMEDVAAAAKRMVMIRLIV
jgi:deazaflavin-dependent oxidoreductase (nitroreductase family)